MNNLLKVFTRVRTILCNLNKLLYINKLFHNILSKLFNAHCLQYMNSLLYFIDPFFKFIKNII